MLLGIIGIFNFIIFGGKHLSIKLFCKNVDQLLCKAESIENCKPLFIKLEILTIHKMFDLINLIHIKKPINEFYHYYNLHRYPTG